MQRATTGGNTNKRKASEVSFSILSVDHEKGEITAYGERFLVIPNKLIHSIEDKLTQLLDPATASTFLYEIGKQAGRDAVHMVKRTGNPLKTSEDAQDSIEDLGTLGGWGRVTLMDYEPDNNYIRARWTNGISIRARDGTVPVCHFTRGIMSGGAEELFGRKAESIETMCQGKGDPFCEVVFADPATITQIAEKLSYASSTTRS